jgi:hypothetical protein
MAEQVAESDWLARLARLCTRSGGLPKTVTSAGQVVPVDTRSVKYISDISPAMRAPFLHR